MFLTTIRLFITGYLSRGIWALSGNFAFMAYQWLLGIAISNFIGTDAFAQYSLALAIVSPLLLLTGSSLKIAHITDVRRRFSDAAYLGLRCAGGGVSLLLLSVFFLFYSRLVENFNITDYFVPAFCVLGIKLAESVGDFHQAILIRDGRIEKASAMLGMRSLSALTITSLVAYWCLNLGFSLLAGGATLLLMIVITDFTTFRATGVSFPGALRLYRFCWPLPLTSFLITLTAVIPRLVLDHYMDLVAVAAFSGAFLFVSVGVLAVQSIGNLVNPKIATAIRSGEFLMGKNYVSIIYAFLVAFGLLMVLLSFFFGSQLFIFVYGPEAAKWPNILPLMSIGAALSLILAFSNNLLVILDRYDFQLIVTISGAALCAVTAVILVPKIGISGAVLGWSSAILFSTILTLQKILRVLHGG